MTAWLCAHVLFASGIEKEREREFERMSTSIQFVGEVLVAVSIAGALHSVQIIERRSTVPHLLGTLLRIFLQHWHAQGHHASCAKSASPCVQNKFDAFLFCFQIPVYTVS